MITLVNANTPTLNNVTLNIPTQKLTVVTGSETFTTSLAIDVIYNESQNRFAHLVSLNNENWKSTASANVQFIAGLMPTIAINFDAEAQLNIDALFLVLNNVFHQKLRGILYLVNANFIDASLDQETNILSILYKTKSLGNTIILTTNNANLIKNAEYVIATETNANGEEVITFKGTPNEALKKQQGVFYSVIEKATVIELDKNEDIFNLYDPMIFENIAILKKEDKKIEIIFNQINTVVTQSQTDKIELFELLSSHPFSKFKQLCGFDFENNKLPKLFPKVKTSGLMTTIGINAMQINPTGTETICTLTQIETSLKNLCTFLKTDTLFGLSLETIKNMPIFDLLQEFRKKVVVPNAFSTDATLQRSAQIMAGAVINMLDILEKLAFGTSTLNKKVLALNKGELTRVKLATAVSKDMSGICFVIDEPTEKLAPEHLQNLFFMLHELKRQGNTIVAFENNEGFISFSDNTIETK